MSLEHEASGLLQTVLYLGSAVVAVPLFKRLGLGSVLGYLCAGLLLSFFGFAGDQQAIMHLAEFGIVMFLFIIGLEMEPAHLWHLRRTIFGLGALQVFSCLIFLTIGVKLLNYDWKVAFVAGAGFVVTSSAIVMQILAEREAMNSDGGRKIIAILLFEDLMLVPLLAVVSFLAPAGAKESTPLWQSIGMALLALAALIIFGRYILRGLFYILAKNKAHEVLVASALFVVLTSAYLMELGGLSMAMGAFIAGVLLSESPFRHQLESDIEPFRGLLLGLFFLGVGMSLDLTVVLENFWLVMGGMLLLKFAKGLGVFLVAKLAKSNRQQALSRAVLMSQGGEFSFVIYTAAVNSGVLEPETAALLTAIVVLSMASTPLFLILEKLFSKKQPLSEPREADEIHEQRNVLIIGLGRFGQVIYRMLDMCGYHCTVIDNNVKTINDLKKFQFKGYFGEGTNPKLLRTAGIEKADVLVVTNHTKDNISKIVKFARSVNPHLRIIARAIDRQHVYELHHAGADEIVRETFDSAVRTGKRTLEAVGLDHELAEKLGDLFFKLDRDGLETMARLYNPNISNFDNQALIDEALRLREEGKAKMQALLHSKDKEKEKEEEGDEPKAEELTKKLEVPPSPTDETL